jgi:hypothetical protein
MHSALKSIVGIRALKPVAAGMAPGYGANAVNYVG